MKFVTWGILLLLLLFAGYTTWQSEITNELGAGKQKNSEEPIQLRRPILYDYESGRLKWKFMAKSAEVFEKQDLTLFNQINGKIYSKTSDEISTKVKADRGKITGKSKIMTLSGNIEIDYIDGQKVYTEHLTIDQNKEVLFNNTDVLGVSATETIKAKSMYYDIKSEVLTLEKPDTTLLIDM